jgi:hypothetical protein
LKVDSEFIVSLGIRHGSIIVEVIISSQALASDLISQIQQGLFKVRYSDGSPQEVDGYDASTQPAPSTAKSTDGLGTPTIIIIVLGALLTIAVVSFFVVMQRRKAGDAGTIVSNRKAPSAFSNPMCKPIDLCWVEICLLLSVFDYCACIFSPLYYCR